LFFVTLSEYSSLGVEVTRSELVSAFVKLLKDSEAEVRTAAAAKVTGISSQIELDQVLKHILPCVHDLGTTHQSVYRENPEGVLFDLMDRSVLFYVVSDDNQHVRASLASDVMGLSPIFGKEGTVQHLLELFLQLLKDDFPEVRLNIISKLDKVTKVIGIELLSQHLMPAIVELAEDRQFVTFFFFF
jgi:serine/threonine-protein phosphatase 2A regulatory subunit A